MVELPANEDKLKKKEDQGWARRGQAGRRGYAEWIVGLLDWCEASEAGARRDAGLSAEWVKSATSAVVADGQLASQWWSDDAVQHLKIDDDSQYFNSNPNELLSFRTNFEVFKRIKVIFKNEVWYYVKSLSTKN
jgi:hypothetical protein